MFVGEGTHGFGGLSGQFREPPQPTRTASVTEHSDLFDEGFRDTLLPPRSLLYADRIKHAFMEQQGEVPPRKVLLPTPTPGSVVLSEAQRLLPPPPSSPVSSKPSMPSMQSPMAVSTYQSQHPPPGYPNLSPQMALPDVTRPPPPPSHLIGHSPQQMLPPVSQMSPVMGQGYLGGQLPPPFSQSPHVHTNQETLYEQTRQSQHVPSPSMASQTALMPPPGLSSHLPPPFEHAVPQSQGYNVYSQPSPEKSTYQQHQQQQRPPLPVESPQEQWMMVQPPQPKPPVETKPMDPLQKIQQMLQQQFPGKQSTSQLGGGNQPRTGAPSQKLDPRLARRCSSETTLAAGSQRRDIPHSHSTDDLSSKISAPLATSVGGIQLPPDLDLFELALPMAELPQDITPPKQRPGIFEKYQAPGMQQGIQLPNLVQGLSVGMLQKTLSGVTPISLSQLTGSLTQLTGSLTQSPSTTTTTALVTTAAGINKPRTTERPETTTTMTTTTTLAQTVSKERGLNIGGKTVPEYIPSAISRDNPIETDTPMEPEPEVEDKEEDWSLSLSSSVTEEDPAARIEAQEDTFSMSSSASDSNSSSSSADSSTPDDQLTDDLVDSIVRGVPLAVAKAAKKQSKPLKNTAPAHAATLEIDNAQKKAPTTTPEKQETKPPAETKNTSDKVASKQQSRTNEMKGDMGKKGEGSKKETTEVTSNMTER